MKLIYVLFLSSYGISQNLVQNGSFETISSCPTSVNQLNYATFWTNPSSWGTPDLANSCSSSFGIPSFCNCNLIYQYPRTGNSYAGIYTFGASVINGREYLQNELSTSLNQNECYKISFFVNLTNGSNYATNNLGAYLSLNQISSSNSILNYIPSFVNKNIINDTLNWIEISGIYKATGDEKYLTIGNFLNDSETSVLLVNNTVNDASYYLIDDVSVIPIASIPGGMPANAGPDLAITSGDSVFIGQEISNLNCTWSILGGPEIADSTSGIYVQPLENTSYVVEQNLCGVISYDTVTVFVFGVGVDETLGGTDFVKVYPNPNSGNFYVFSKDLFEIDVLDMQGRKVNFDSSAVKESVLEINCACSKGIYHVIVQTRDKIDSFIINIVK